jgi:hypothetical protein
MQLVLPWVNGLAECESMNEQKRGTLNGKSGVSGYKGNP